MRLSTKLSLAFAAVATLPVLAASPLVLRAVADAFDDELRGRLDAAERAVAGAQRELAAEVVRAVDGLAASDAVGTILQDMASDENWAAAHVPDAERLMSARELDVLALLDGHGVVISSGHLPARVGDADPAGHALARSHPGVAVARWVELRSENGIVRQLALVAARPAARGPATLHLLAGKAIGPALATRLAQTAGASIELREAGTGTLLASAAQPGLERRGPAAGPLAELALLLIGAPEDRTRSVPILGEAGAPVAELRATVSAAGLATAQARILGTGAALLLGGLCLALALGVLLARRIVRPVEALASGAAAVAAGDLEHRVETRAAGELKELVTSFNRMTSDLKREKDRAAVAERVAAWREVARRLAHEIKNPLTPIAMAIETLRDAHAARSPDLDELFAGSSRTILEEVGRLKKIVDEFSRFARLPPPDLQPHSLSELAEQILGLYGSMPAGITLTRSLAVGLPPVRADRDQVTQVLLNLLQNAEQALAGRGGRITVRTCGVPGAVLLEIADDGPGIPAAELERIFEPYFTTKESGTGLGLAIARRIAEEHGGALEAESGPGTGATFRFRLPVA